LPPPKYILLNLHETEHLKFLSIGIEEMISARTDHQIGTGLCELHYFNAVPPNKSNTGRRHSKRHIINITDCTKAWSTVNSINGVTNDTTCRGRTRSRRLCTTSINVIGLGLVIVDG